MTVSSDFDDRQAIIAIKDTLQSNLTDPREQYTNAARTWVHTDKPLSSAAYPRIQVRKRGPTTTEIISPGKEFIEWRSVILDIQFWTETPFKWKDANNLYYADEEFVKYYLNQIWVKLKAAQSTLQSTYGITGLKLLTDEDPYIEPDTQLYTGIVSVRIWYFVK